MASIQERLQLKRVPLDKWTVREQLCLASAVACSGDQNWMSVSRTLKILCGGNRPSDWFSQKSCAAQYGKLLENVETPKRKKRNEKDTTPSSVETPGECILRKLTQERVSELNKLIQDEHRDYTKTKNEILSIQLNSVDESKFHEMWTQTEIEKKQREKEQLQHAQWLKEREERKIEMERSWRPTALHLYQQQQQQQLQQQQQQQNQNSPNDSPSKLNLKLKSEDMDTDDGNLRQGTSPLLTSLLKSPSPAPNSTNTLIHSSGSGGGGGGGSGSVSGGGGGGASSGNMGSSTSSSSTIPSSRVVAPTITNLLTGSTSHHISSSTLTSSTSTSNSTFQLIQHSLTGPPPPPYDPCGSNNIPGGTVSSLVVAQSPSQAAPTLSMLLENKSKDQIKATHQTIVASTTSSATSSSTPIVVNAPSLQFVSSSSGSIGGIVGINQTSSSTQKQNQTYSTRDEAAEAQQIKDEDQQLMEVFNGLIPDNIDELADILTENNANILNGELLEEESMLENVESLIAEQEGNLENVNISGEFSGGGGVGVVSSEVANTGIAGFQILQQTTQLAPSATTTMTKTINNQNHLKFTETGIPTDVKIENEDCKPTNEEISANEHTNKIEIKDEDQSSSDVSNDVPLASLLNTSLSEFDKKSPKLETKDSIEVNEKKCDAGKNLEKADKTDVAACEVDGSRTETTEELKREGPDIFESDSNDDKCLESIKREIHELSGLKDNNSDNSNDETQNKPELKSKVTEEVATKSEISHNPTEIVDIIEPTDKEAKNIEIESTDFKEMDRPLAGFSDGSPTTISPTESLKFENKSIRTAEAKNSSSANISNDTTKVTAATEIAPPQDTVEIVEIKDDKSDDGKQESFIIIEETDDTNSEENTSEEVKMETVNIKDDDDDDDDDENENDGDDGDDNDNDEAEEDEYEEEENNQKSIASKNEDFFPIDKDAIEDAKGDDSESMSESKSVDQTITIIDTDDDSPIEVVKEDKIGKTKRDYSRRKTDSSSASGSLVEKRQEEIQSGSQQSSNEIIPTTININPTNTAPAVVEEQTLPPSNKYIGVTSTNLNLRTTKLKENYQNRSESPCGGGGGSGNFVNAINDEESSDSPLRSKRRYSSTPNIDSLPNSPASSDDRDYRAWKKSILMVLNRLNNHKYSNSFAKPITDEQLPGYRQIILRPMDLNIIKKNIDSGVTRTTAEFERDLRLMCYNCFMFDCKELITESMAQEFLKDALKNIDTVMEVWKKDNEKLSNPNDRTPITKTVRSRKSHRLPAN